MEGLKLPLFIATLLQYTTQKVAIHMGSTRNLTTIFYVFLNLERSRKTDQPQPFSSLDYECEDELSQKLI